LGSGKINIHRRPMGARHPSISPEREAEIRTLLEKGMGIRSVARLVGAGNGVVAKIRKQVKAVTFGI